MAREKWSNKVEGVLTLIGYTVGLSNIYRFPYLCLRNGGGTFLIPYMFFLAVLGLPLCVLEIFLGQFSGLSPITVWNICPLFSGMGLVSVFINGLLFVTYIHIVSWSLRYVYASISWDIPWRSCNNSWNTPACFDHQTTLPSMFNYTNQTGHVPNGSNVSIEYNITDTLKSISAAQEYYENYILGLSSGINDIGKANYGNIIAYAFTIIIVMIAVCKGIKFMGKVIYLTVLSPYVIITILVIRSAFLPGAWQGLEFFFTLDSSKLAEFSVWYEALLQVFFSLGPGWGGMVMMAAHNEYKNNFLRDGITICVVCCLSSIYGGITTFSVLGFLSHKSGLPLQQVARSGPGLSFITYPEAIAEMPFAPFWSFIFYFMLYTISLEFFFIAVEFTVYAIIEYEERLRKYRIWLVASVCALLFLIGLPLTFGNGMYIFQIFDWYCLAIVPMLWCLIECISIAYCYGLTKARKDAEHILGYKPSWFWLINWSVICPVLLLFMLIYGFVAMTEPSYGSYTYPRWPIAMAWVVNVGMIIPLPAAMVLNIWKHPGSLLEKLKVSITATSEWKSQSTHPCEKIQYTKAGTADGEILA